MTATDPTKKAIDLAGGSSAVARLFGITPWAVSKWERVPERRIRALCKAIGWKVTPHELDPELFEHPDDGLPPELRGRRKAGGE